MENRAERYRTLTQVVRWTARVWSIASIGLVLLFLVGEGFNPARLKPTEWLGFLFFPAGISAGMIVAWWREGFGGSITAGSLLVFYLIHLSTAGTFPKGWAWLAFAAPGFLFLLCWHSSRKASTPAA
jgi:hypothetical protein